MDTEKKTEPDKPPDLLATRIESNGDLEDIKSWYRWGRKTWQVVKGIGVLVTITAGVLGSLYTAAKLLGMLSE